MKKKRGKKYEIAQRQKLNFHVLLNNAERRKQIMIKCRTKVLKEVKAYGFNFDLSSSGEESIVAHWTFNTPGKKETLNERQWKGLKRSIPERFYYHLVLYC